MNVTDLKEGNRIQKEIKRHDKNISLLDCENFCWPFRVSDDERDEMYSILYDYFNEKIAELEQEFSGIGTETKEITD